MKRILSVVAIGCVGLFLAGCSSTRWQLFQMQMSWGDQHQNQYYAPVLLDSKTGDTYALITPSQGPVWVPITVDRNAWGPSHPRPTVPNTMQKTNEMKRIAEPSAAPLPRDPQVGHSEDER